MVAKMMRWPPWPPSTVVSRKFEVKVVVIGLHGLRIDEGGDDPEKDGGGILPRVTTEVRWKGPRSALRNLRRSVRRNCTKEAPLVEDKNEDEVKDRKPEQKRQQKVVGGEGEEEEDDDDDEIQEEIKEGRRKRFGKVVWNEEFLSVCTLTSNINKANSNLHPWEISFLVFNSPSLGQRNKVMVIGTALLDLAEFAASAENKDTEIHIPLSTEGKSTEAPVSLHLSISFSELRTTQLSSESTQKAGVPIPFPPQQRDAPPPAEKDEISALKLGLRKVKILKELVSKSKKIPQEDEGSDERYSGRSDDVDFVDTDSMDDDLDKGEEEGGKQLSDIRKSFSYGTLASANIAGGSLYSDMGTNGDYEDWIYYSHRRSDVGFPHKEEVATTSDSELLPSQTSKRSILPWKRRKLFKSPKSKGEPLLKPYGEEGGDDIDFDRRQMSSSDESLSQQKMDEDTLPNQPSISEFGDDSFIIGSWETKEIISRDTHMKLCSQVFFASIDQRSVRAAGESACTALVAVIANWFQTNLQVMPIKSQFDSLIREGSLEWRNLCENETYRERFPDKHFDLDTVLQAKIRPLSVVPSKSFIGFFHPEFAATNDDDGDKKSNNGFEILDGAMSFDNIWDEISQAAMPSDGTPQLYIVSWNDHFFILMVEPDAYYIIDTLGERLYEGCEQAYILKFDKNTSIQKMPSENKSTNGGEVAEISGKKQVQQKNGMKSDEDSSEEEPSHNSTDNDVERDEISVCRGKESCKEYIKNFLAAIPIRELQDDMKKGLLSSTPIHQRLQIEFHYTEAELAKGTVSEDMEVLKEEVEVVVPQETFVVKEE